jgi:integration host factor subunit alpha
MLFFISGASVMALTKTQIVDSVQERIGFSRKKSTDLIENLIEIIKATIETGDDVLISGFGKFCVKQKGVRKGRNPATGEDMMLDGRKVVTFKCSSVLRDKVNL